jgi:hypothetical protein
VAVGTNTVRNKFVYPCGMEGAGWNLVFTDARAFVNVEWQSIRYMTEYGPGLSETKFDPAGWSLLQTRCFYICIN